MLDIFDVLCALDCIADNVLELYRSPSCDALFERSSGLGVNGMVRLLFRCVTALVTADVEAAGAVPIADDDELFLSAYGKFSDDDALFAFDAVVVADAIDDNTGNACVPLYCCVEDVENAVL